MSASSSSLRRAGLKVTRPRLALLEVLMESHGPFTMEELHRKLPKETCDLVTVYRCLSAFEEAGLVQRCDFGDGSFRYELGGEEAHHHHVVCRRCGTVDRLDLCLVESIERQLQSKGYRDITHRLEFFALCASCGPN